MREVLAANVVRAMQVRVVNAQLWPAARMLTHDEIAGTGLSHVFSLDVPLQDVDAYESSVAVEAANLGEAFLLVIA